MLCPDSLGLAVMYNRNQPVMCALSQARIRRFLQPSGASEKHFPSSH